MGLAPRTRAADSQLIRRLDAEWRALAQSRELRDRLTAWGSADSRLAFDHGDRLIEAAQRTDVESWAERDQVLTALLERVADDALARRVALQAVLPGLKSLITEIRGWDVEERAARIVTTALDVISWCASEPARTPPSFRIYTNTRRRVLRSVVRARNEPLVLVEDGELDEVADPSAEVSETERIDQLVAWIQERAHLREDMARLVVMTRSAGFSVDEIAKARHIDPRTLRQRRLRAERQIRKGLSLAL